MTRWRDAVVKVDGIVARGEGALLVALFLALIGVTFAQVVARYALNDPLIWSEEAARYLFVWLSLIGAARGMHDGAHFNLDLVLQRLSPALRTVCEAAVMAVIAFFLVILIVTGLAQMNLAASQFATTLPITMDLPYLAIPAGSMLMLFHLFGRLARFGLGDPGRQEIEV